METWTTSEVMLSEGSYYIEDKNNQLKETFSYILNYMIRARKNEDSHFGELDFNINMLKETGLKDKQFGWFLTDIQ